MNISPKTNVSVPLSVVWASVVFLVGATAFLVGAYAETTAVPKRVDALETKILEIEKNLDDRDKRDRLNCLILQRIQKTIVPENYRIEAECK